MIKDLGPVMVDMLKKDGAKGYRRATEPLT